MAKDQRNVEAITPMEVDFAKWYTDICLKAELVDYASVKGFMILRPYGYAIWENIQRIMDGMFKKTGHVNVAMPVLIPESLLKKEGELVEGFAPEVAWVTMGGSEKLEERLAFRPTSETNNACPSLKKTASCDSCTISCDNVLKSSAGCLYIRMSLSPSYLITSCIAIYFLL